MTVPESRGPRNHQTAVAFGSPISLHANEEEEVKKSNTIQDSALACKGHCGRAGYATLARANGRAAMTPITRERPLHSTEIGLAKQEESVTVGKFRLLSPAKQRRTFDLGH